LSLLWVLPSTFFPMCLIPNSWAFFWVGPPPPAGCSLFEGQNPPRPPPFVLVAHRFSVLYSWVKRFFFFYTVGTFFPLYFSFEVMFPFAFCPFVCNFFRAFYLPVGITPPPSPSYSQGPVLNLFANQFFFRKSVCFPPPPQTLVFPYPFPPQHLFLGYCSPFFLPPLHSWTSWPFFPLDFQVQFFFFVPWAFMKHPLWNSFFFALIIIPFFTTFLLTFLGLFFPPKSVKLSPLYGTVLSFFAIRPI